MTSMPRRTPFRAGGTEGPKAKTRFTAAAAGPAVLLADVSEWEPDITDAAYLAWSPAIVIRAAYGDQHDDRAWYGGQRRDMLHKLGARVIGIYQYLAAGQDPAAQAQAFNDLVGDLRPGEVLIPDFEEGQHAMLTGWYNAQLADRGQAVRPYLWTYSGLNFGQAQGALPVEWVAAYGQGEPATPHRLWQFTDSFPVPGVGEADCSVFHGTISELAAMTYQGSRPAPAPVPAVSWAQWPASLTLLPGASGAAVKVLQTALRNSGIHGARGIAVDGAFGQQTETALRNFQRGRFGAAGTDGVAGPRTRTALAALGDL